MYCWRFILIYYHHYQNCDRISLTHRIVEMSGSLLLVSLSYGSVWKSGHSFIKSRVSGSLPHRGLYEGLIASSYNTMYGSTYPTWDCRKDQPILPNVPHERECPILPRFPCGRYTLSHGTLGRSGWSLLESPMRERKTLMGLYEG